MSLRRLKIAFFGRRNAGKSSLINALAGQEVALVSPVAGTTSDPISKTMELPPLGPVTLTDTPGLDDEGALGGERVRRAEGALRGADVLVLVCDGEPGEAERKWLEGARGRPVVVVANKCDLRAGRGGAAEGALEVSAATGEGLEALRLALGEAAKQAGGERGLLEGLVEAGDVVVLVAPIDASAPKGRLILPQQETLRELLDRHAAGVVVQPGELAAAMERLGGKAKLVVTDSQAFAAVAATLGEEQALTSFSILYARRKGDLAAMAVAARRIAELKDGDRVLIAEGCTHHREEDDIGTVKIPRLLRAKTGKRLEFEHTAGAGWAADLGRYALIVHCGGCMLTRGEMLGRLAEAEAAGVPMTNYGVAIAAATGILERALRGAGAAGCEL